MAGACRRRRKKAKRRCSPPLPRRQEARRPADLTFDFLDELLDDGGSTLRLFALDGDERLTAFAPGVVHLDGGADDERATNERHQQGGVFAEEPASLLRVL